MGREYPKIDPALHQKIHQEEIQRDSDFFLNVTTADRLKIKQLRRQHPCTWYSHTHGGAGLIYCSFVTHHRPGVGHAFRQRTRSLRVHRQL